MMTCVLYKLCSYMPNVVDSFGDILGVACRTASHHNLYILTLTHISPDWCCMSDSGAMLHHLSFDCFAVFPRESEGAWRRYVGPKSNSAGSPINRSNRVLRY